MKRLAIIIFLLIAVNAQAYQGTRTGEEVDQGVGVGIDVGATTGLIKSDGADGISAAVAGTDYIAPASNVALDDGAADSPYIRWINESNEYCSMYLHDNGTLVTNCQAAAAIYVYPGSGFNFGVIPVGEGDGLIIADVGGDTSIKLNVANGTTTLSLTGSLWPTGDIKFTDGRSILDASGDAALTFNDGQEVALPSGASFTGFDTVNLTTVDKYKVGGNPLVDDDGTNGDTDKVWSADKSYDQLALKAPLASPTFTGTVGAATITATGNVTGLLETATDADAHTLTSAEYHGGTVLATGAGIYTLPTAAAGLSGCVEAGYGVTAIIQLLPGTGDYIVHQGARGTAATSIKSGADAGDRICYRAYNATDWYVTTYGTWAE